jgi:adenylate cyclase
MSDRRAEVEELWREWFMMDAFQVEKRLHGFFPNLPHNPRCEPCHTPLHGIGGLVLGTLFGRRQSNINPRFCNVCEEFAKKHPGGAEVVLVQLSAIQIKHRYR